MADGAAVGRRAAAAGRGGAGGVRGGLRAAGAALPGAGRVRRAAPAHHHAQGARRAAQLPGGQVSLIAAVDGMT